MLKENSDMSRSTSALKRRVAMGLDQPDQTPPIEETDVEELLVGDNGEEEHEED